MGPHAAVEPEQYLTFFIAGEEYAVNVLRVREIIPYDTLTKMPHTPPAVRGVINLRGSVIPVADLSVKFGLGESRVTKLTCIVIVEVKAGEEVIVMGVITDAVSQVCPLGPDEIEKAPSFGAAVDRDFLKGVGKMGKKFLLILDVDRVLSAESLRAMSPAPKAPAPDDGR